MKGKNFTEFAVAAALLLAALPSPTQQKPVLHTPDAAPAPAASPSAAPVAVTALVAVHDKKDAPVQGLTRNDLVLQVDGHPQAIGSLAPAGTLPLTLGLVVDTSPAEQDQVDSIRNASQSFVDGLVGGSGGGAAVNIFVMQFGKQVELLEDPTASHAKLQSALNDLGTQGTSSRDQPDTDTDSGTGGKKGATRKSDGVLFDAAFLASDDVLAKREGRRVLVIVSDGQDSGSKETDEEALEAAQRGNAVIYAIYVKGDEPKPERQRNVGNGGPGGGYPGGGYPGGGYPGGYPGGGYPRGGYPGGGYPGGGYPGGGGPAGGGNGNPQRVPATHADGRKALERLANRTGGEVLEVSRRQSLAQAYMRIADDLRSQYLLSFTPEAPLGSGYHQVDLAPKTADEKKMTVLVRDGFYGGK